MNAPANIEALRPAFMQSMPVKIERVFDDPDAVVRFIQERAPYPTLIAYHGGIGGSANIPTMPWFRTHFDEDWLLNNEQWIAAAKKTFSAEIVRPFKCILNINGAMPDGGKHVDLPVFRGFAAPQAPVWFLMNMSYSQLFLPWMVPIASGLAWFYKGIGGAFEYWVDGPDQPPQVERRLWNNGVMSDNEFMFHRVDAIGTPEDQARLSVLLKPSDLLHYVGGDRWEIRDGDDVMESLAADQLRISLLWKAYVFADEVHLASFQKQDMDLRLDQIVDIYLDDLKKRGATVDRPTDPFTDPVWQKVLDETYSPYHRTSSD
jgi:hypothetical protein